MEIKISKASLSEALSNVQSVVGGKTSLQVLQNVKMSTRDGKAEFTCTDLDITLLARAECEVVEEGETTIPVKTFSSAVSKLVEGEIKIVVNNQDVTKLSSGQTSYKFIGLPAKDYPNLPEADGTSITLPANAIRDMFRKTSFASSQDETRRTLQGVLLDFSEGNGNVKAVATDGRRLALLNADVGASSGFDGRYIIPRKAVDILYKKLPKEGDCSIVIQGSQICFKTAKLDFTTKLVDDTYPNYRQVIPESTKETVVANRVEVLGAIDRVSVLSSLSDAPSMSMEFADNKLVVTTNSAKYGEARDEMPIKYLGKKIVMHFNPQYIKEALGAMDEDEIEFRLTDGTKPAIIKKSGNESYTYVCMPLRTA